jgi:hypothetical protein
MREIDPITNRPVGMTDTMERFEKLFAYLYQRQVIDDYAVLDDTTVCVRVTKEDQFVKLVL